MYYIVPSVGIFQNINKFRLLTTTGGEIIFDGEALLAYLFSHNKTKVKDIQEKMTNVGIRPSEEQLSQFLFNMVNDGFLRLSHSKVSPPFNLERVVQNIIRKTFYPPLSRITIVISTECPYNCKGCLVKSENIHEEIEDHVLIRLVDEISELGCNYLNLSGGEIISPSLIEKTLSAVRHASTLGIDSVTISTSGMYLHKYIKKLKAAGITRLIISMHGFEGHMEDYCNNPQALTNSLKAIKISLKEKIDTTINYIIVKNNLSQIDKVIDWASNHGFFDNRYNNYIRFAPIMYLGKAKEHEELFLTLDDLKFVYHKIKNSQKIYKNFVRYTYDQAFDPTTPLICDAGINYAYINADGNVYPCDTLDGLCMGNIEKESFLEIWSDNRKWSKFREIVPLNNMCISCSNRLFCIGKCKGISYIKFKSLTMDRPYCKAI